VTKTHDYAGWCAVILASGVAASLVISSIGGTIRGHMLTPDEITLLSTITGAAIGAVATYLGTSRRGPEEDDTDDDDLGE
jgi:uncharacterized membrane protein